MVTKIEHRMVLALLLATLLAVCASSYLVIKNEHDNSMSIIRAEGTTLSFLLANLPYQQLITNESTDDKLKNIQTYISNMSLEYVAVVETNGRLLNNIYNKEVVLPDIDLSQTQLQALSEQTLAKTKTFPGILEFRSPVLIDGNLNAFIRVGYSIQNQKIDASYIPLIAQESLPIVVLLVFFYYLSRRVLKPIERANKKLRDFIKDKGIDPGNLDHGDELRGFMQGFNHYLSITEKKLKELEDSKNTLQTANHLLAFYKNRVESILQILPDVIVIIGEDGTVVYANHKIESLMGIPLDNIMGKQPHEWCENDQVVSLLARYHGNITPLRRIESVNFNPSNMPDKTINVRAYPLESKKGTAEMLGISVIFRDVTSEVRLAQSKDEFIAHVSHEVKSPLTVISLQAELLSENSDGNSKELVEGINVIQDEIERLSIMINNLLSITRIESGTMSLKRQAVKMHEFLDDTFTSTMRGTEEKSITGVVNISNTLSVLEIDKELLRVAIKNLLTNAIKYNIPGGTVTLDAEEVDDQVLIKISDSGIGISSSETQYIFNKFYRSESNEVRERSGHGLGLALTKQIIDLHKGELYVESKIGEGTVFTIKLMKRSSLLKEVG